MRIFWKKSGTRRNATSSSRNAITGTRERIASIVGAVWEKRSWLVLLLVIILVGLLATHPYFRVQQIECTYGNNSPCPEEILEELQQLQGEHVLYVQSQSTVAKLEDALSEIDLITITPVLPHSLAVQVKLHEPKLYLQTEPGGNALVISDVLEVIRADETLDMELPRVMYSQAFVYSIGDQIEEPVVKFAKGLIDELKQEYVSFLWMEIVDAEQVLVELANGNQAVFSAAVDPQSQVDALVQVQTHMDFEDGNKIIEVRFEQPVIKSR